MAVKRVKGVIIPRHDTAENWAKARNFIPKKGELIIYDADTITYEVEGTPSSDKVRIKIGDGETNVNLLPFVTTEHSGGSGSETGDMSNYYTKEEIEAYIANNVGAIVYLTTKESISENIELQDVYPIQDAESELRIVSKNRIKYSSEYASTTFSGINVDANPSNRIVLVSGKATSKVENQYATVSRVELPVNGKYTISVDNSGIDQAEKKCYIVYNLWNRSVLDSSSNFEDQGNIVRYLTRLTADNPITIDTEEMNCGVIEFKVFVNSPSGGTFADANSQYFRIQVEYGEEATHYHAPMPETGIAGKKINIYGKNLLEELVTDIPSGSPIKLDGVEVGTFSGDDLGVFYWKGVMQRDFLITISTTGYTNDIKVPLLEGDEYTIVGNLERVSYGYGTIRDFRLVKGHTDYDESSPYEMESIECDANGVCNISHLKYPYSYIALDNFNGENNGYAIYLKYDPALSRDWTENQLNKIDKRLNKVEAGNIDLNNYYTKNEIDTVASQLMDSIANSSNDIVVSETEPTVSQETIWLQPIAEENVAYIVETILDDSNGQKFYIEKWSNGIVKCYGTIDESEIIDKTLYPDNYTKGVVEIDKTHCVELISHTITPCNLQDSEVKITPIHTSSEIESAGRSFFSKYKLFFDDSVDSYENIPSNLTTSHMIIGKWK